MTACAQTELSPDNLLLRSGFDCHKSTVQSGEHHHNAVIQLFSQISTIIMP